MANPKFITGAGEVFTAQSPADADKLRQLGLKELSAEDVRVDDLKKQYSSALYGPVSAGLGLVSGGLPGATSAVVGGLTAIAPETGHAVSDAIAGIEGAHPIPNIAGIAGGAIGGAMLSGGVSLLANAGRVATVAKGAVLGAAMVADSLALQHLDSPEGAEKIPAALGLGALFGGLGSIVFPGAMKWVGAGGGSKVGQALEEKGAAKLAEKTPLGNPGVQAQLEKQGAADAVADLAKQHDLFGKSPKQVRAKLADILKSSTATMNEAKAVSTETLPADEAGKFMNELRQRLAGTGVKGAEKVEQTVGDLHQLRIKLDKQINWQDPNSAVSQKLIGARDFLDSQITKLLEHNATINPALAGDQVARWQAANADYAATKALQDAMRYGEATGKSWLGSVGHKVASAGGTGVLFGGMAGNPGTMASGAAMWAGGKVTEGLAEGQASARVVQGLGKFLQTFDEHVVQSVKTGLEKTGVAKTTDKLGPAAVKLAGLADYQTIAAGISWVTENPSRAIPRMAQHMEEQGIPGPLVDSTAPQAIKAAQYLKSVIAMDPWVGQSVAPTQWQPTVAQKAAVVDAANAINNPLWALNNPTPGRMAAVKAVYPTLAEKVSLMVAQEAAARPDMSLAARRWASAITGQPATPLATQLAQVAQARLDMAEKLQAQVQKQGGGKGGGGGHGAGSGNIIQSSQSRLNRMSE
jgi:hypothetical protein